eukprot:scaffold263568_cov18-Tisochrysis_lutea.AAC.1
MHCVQNLSVRRLSLAPTASSLLSAPKVQHQKAAQRVEGGMSRLQGPLLLISDIDDTIMVSEALPGVSAASGCIMSLSQHCKNALDVRPGIQFFALSMCIMHKYLESRRSRHLG